jgi:hypothetical protein
LNCNVYNDAGSVTELFKNLRTNSVSRFNSIDEILKFRKNYHNEIENYKKEIKDKIINEINILTDKNKNINDDYNKHKAEQNLLVTNKIEKLDSILQNLRNDLFSRIKKHYSKKKLNYIKSNFDKIIEKPLKSYSYEMEKNKNIITYLTNNQNDEIDKRAKSFTEEMEFLNTQLNNNSSLIYGSIGELKAIEVLKQLPNEYYIINDFRESFNPPLYSKNENERIYSIQLDHVVVGPTGIYVIETKYWSQKSINSSTLFSPIKQLKRGGFALFIVINDFIKNNRAKVFFNNWGQLKVSVSNILLMMNSSTNEQFQFVKILTENNILGYITKRPIIFNEDQIKYIVNQIK